MPYALDTNDMRFATAQGFNSGDQFFAYLRDAFDTLYAEGDPRGRDAPKMLSIGLHARLAGRPGRIAALARFLDHVRATTRLGRAADRHRAALDCNASLRAPRGPTTARRGWTPYKAGGTMSASKWVERGDLGRYSGTPGPNASYSPLAPEQVADRLADVFRHLRQTRLGRALLRGPGRG